MRGVEQYMKLSRHRTLRHLAPVNIPDVTPATMRL